MPVFNAGFMRPGAKKGGNSYGVLIDQLAIREAELNLDGNLSPGDYDVLLKEARQLATNPGFTPDQRSNLLVKISDYQVRKNSSIRTHSNDAKEIERSIQNDDIDFTRAYATAPRDERGQFPLFAGRSEFARVKVERLSQAADDLRASGSDSTELDLAVTDALYSLQDALDIQAAVEGYQDGSGAPISNFAAFIETNSRGEIKSIEFGRKIPRSGYSETNALYNGLSVYGKPNVVQGSKNKVFKLGNTEYLSSGLTVLDPETNEMRDAPLLSATFKGENKYGIINEGWEPVDLSQVRSQSLIRPGEYARGQNGSLYKSLETGGYRKYLGVDKDQLGLRDTDITNVSKTTEDSFNVNETIPGASVPQMSMEPGAFEPGSAAPQPTGPALQPPAPAPAGRARTPSPIERAPNQVPGIVGKTIASAKSYLSSVFR